MSGRHFARAAGVGEPMRRLVSGLLLTAVALGVGIWWASGRQSRPDSLAWRAVARDLQSRYPDVPTVSTDELAAWLADSSRPAPVLLDARTPAEYAVSHLPGARRVDPDATADDLQSMLGRSEPPVVVYCSVGVRSAGVVERLREAGVSDVHNLEGSIFRWANEGRPLVRDGQRVEEVHPYDAVWGRLLAPDHRAVLD